MEHGLNPGYRSPTHIDVAEISSDKLRADLLRRVERGRRKVDDTDVVPFIDKACCDVTPLWDR